MIVHPAFHRLGLRLSPANLSDQLIDSDVQCSALIDAFRELINEYHPPKDKTYAREIENVMKPCLSFVSGGKPLPPSMASLVKQLKYQLTHVLGSSTEDQAKADLLEWLDDFAEQKITLSTKAICLTLTEKFKTFDESPVILTYSCSSLIQEILEFASKNGANFRVIIVDSFPKGRGQILARSLVNSGVNCQYLLINAINHVIDSASLVLLGADGFLANGAAVCPSGSSQVCMVAKNRNIPVLVACQTYKFCERVQTAAVEHGWPDAEVVPADFVTGVVTELRTLPCSSVPAVLRVKQLY
uniref:Translation initiation factor eIF2B subunit delta n=1 Tax=Romanomermis culicivorax TaxID=13658 RepID=A0A915HIS7_ROMCU